MLQPVCTSLTKPVPECLKQTENLPQQVAAASPGQQVL